MRMVSSLLLTPPNSLSCQRTCDLGSHTSYYTAFSSAPLATDPLLCLLSYWGHQLLAHHLPSHLSSGPHLQQSGSPWGGHTWPQGSFTVSLSSSSFPSTTQAQTHPGPWQYLQNFLESNILLFPLISFHDPDLKPFSNNCLNSTKPSKPISLHFLTAFLYLLSYIDWVLGCKTQNHRALCERVLKWPLSPSKRPPPSHWNPTIFWRTSHN